MKKIYQLTTEGKKELELSSALLRQAAESVMSLYGSPLRRFGDLQALDGLIFYSIDTFSYADES